MKTISNDSIISESNPSMHGIKTKQKYLKNTKSMHYKLKKKLKKSKTKKVSLFDYKLLQNSFDALFDNELIEDKRKSENDNLGNFRICAKVRN